MTSLLSSLGQPPRFPTCSHARTGSARGRSYHSLLAAPPMVHGDGRLPFLPSTHPPRNSFRKSLKLDLLPSGGLLVKKGGGEGLAPQPRSPISGAVDLGCVPSTAPKRSSHYSSTWSSLPQSIPCQQGPLRGQGLGGGARAAAGKQFPAIPAPATLSLQVAFRLEFEFSKSIFLHHLEIQLAAGRSGLAHSFSLPTCNSQALFCH